MMYILLGTTEVISALTLLDVFAGVIFSAIACKKVRRERSLIQ